MEQKVALFPIFAILFFFSLFFAPFSRFSFPSIFSFFHCHFQIQFVFSICMHSTVLLFSHTNLKLLILIFSYRNYWSTTFLKTNPKMSSTVCSPLFSLLSLTSSILFLIVWKIRCRYFFDFGDNSALLMAFLFL